MIPRKLHFLTLLLTINSLCVFSDSIPSKIEVLNTLKKVNQYWMSISPETETDRFESVRWTRGTYFSGHMELYNAYPHQTYLDYALLWGNNNDWEIGQNKNSDPRHADNQCVGQAYIDLFLATGSQNAYMLEPITSSVKGMVESTKADDWNWVDALYMAMPVFARLGTVNEDTAYYEKLYAIYTDTKVSRRLFDTEVGLWYRDGNFLPPFTTQNGKKCFWSRGNGWAYGAHVRTIKYLPENEVHREEYISTFKAMSEALIKVQREDGFWGVSLADPDDFPGPETSGTSFFTYGLAWGVNNGLLDSAKYMPHILKAWHGLVNIAVHENGRLGFVQGVGSKPASSQPVTYDGTQDYAIGAFLLAGTEMLKLGLGSMPSPSNFYVDSVVVETKNKINLYFSEALDKISAQTISNYSINNDITISSATMSDDSLRCSLSVNSLKQKSYIITFNNILNNTGEMLENQMASFYYLSPTIITASGYQDGSTNYPKNTIDYDYSTRWSEQGVSGVWIQYELEEVKMIESINIAFFNGHQRQTYFEVHLSIDGITYSKVLDTNSSGSTTELENFDFDDREAKFIKIVGKGNSSSDWNSYTEVRIDYRETAETANNIQKALSLKLFPNPCKEILFFSTKTQWELLSATSSLLQKGYGNRIDLSSYKPGVFLVKTPQATYKILKK